MRVCCGLTGHLELAQRPDLYGGSVVVGDWDEHVIAASEEALPFGVMPGMPLRQAEHLCPQATFLSPDPAAATRLRELISSALYDLAPVVEVWVEGAAWLDLSTPRRGSRAARSPHEDRRCARVPRPPGLTRAPTG
jgi:DNA polymerase-4